MNDKSWERALDAAAEVQQTRRLEAQKRVEDAPLRLVNDARFHHRVRTIAYLLGFDAHDDAVDLVTKVLAAAEYLDEVSPPDAVQMPTIVCVPGEFITAVAEANRDVSFPGGLMLIPSEVEFTTTHFGGQS